MTTVKNALEAKANNAVQTKKKPKSIKEWIKVMEPEIKKALPTFISWERFARIMQTAVSKNPGLGECTPESFCGAMMEAAQAGLEPNTQLGQAYLIPFRNNKKGVTECQYQLGYKGMINLANRSDVNVSAYEVYENDEFDYEYGLNPKLYHKPSLTDRGRVKCYYAVWKAKNGGFGFEVMSVEDVQKHAQKYSQAYRRGYGSPWTDNFDEMAKKTVIKKVLKYAPLSIEEARHLAQDETIKTSLSDDMTEVPDETVWADYEVVEEDVVDQETGEVA